MYITSIYIYTSRNINLLRITKYKFFLKRESFNFKNYTIRFGGTSINLASKNVKISFLLAGLGSKQANKEKELLTIPFNIVVRI